MKKKTFWNYMTIIGFTSVLFFCSSHAFADTMKNKNNIEWSKYTSHSSTLSAVATGLSMVEPCSVPITYKEAVKGNKVRLTISCPGKEDEEASAIIEFYLVPKSKILFPEKFYFAG